jgi:predicted flap endonuclease-1-like 5' DNA nuclease/gas vesicle protein
MLQALGILFLGILLGLLIEFIYTALFVPNSKEKNKKLEDALHAARKENASLQRWIQKLQGAEAIPTVNSSNEITGKKSEETVAELSGAVSESVALPVADRVDTPIAPVNVSEVVENHDASQTARSEETSPIQVIGHNTAPVATVAVETQPDAAVIIEPTPTPKVIAAETSAEPAPPIEETVADEVLATPEVDTAVEALPTESVLEPTALETPSAVPQTLAEVVTAADADVVVEALQVEAEDHAIQAETTDPNLTLTPSAAEIAQSTVSAEEVVDPATLHSVEDPVLIADEEPDAMESSDEFPQENSPTTGDVNVLASSDFTKIHGIGPKLADLFKEAGITSYKQLANLDISQIDKIFADNSMLYNRAVAITWPQQAKLAEAGDWSALRKFKASRKK